MRKTKLTAALLLALALVFSPAQASDDDSGDDGGNHRQMLGWIEWFVIEPVGLRVRAKLDTGANTASLHGENIEAFERDGEEWVRFDVPLAEVRDVDDMEETPEFRGLRIERPVSRDVHIKRHGAESQRRFVVELPFCINGREHTAEFSLTDRGDFNYPVLLGRRFMAEVIVVDPAETYIAPEECDYRGLDDIDVRRLLVSGEEPEAEPLEADDGEGEGEGEGEDEESEDDASEEEDDADGEDGEG